MFLFVVLDDACGPYGHDIQLQEICAAWKRPPVTEMSVQEYGQWMKVEQQLRELKKQKDLEQMRKFREMGVKPKRHQSRLQSVNGSQNYMLESVTSSQSSNAKVQTPFEGNNGNFISL